MDRGRPRSGDSQDLSGLCSFFLGLFFCQSKPKDPVFFLYDLRRYLPRPSSFMARLEDESSEVVLKRARGGGVREMSFPSGLERRRRRARGVSDGMRGVQAVPQRRKGLRVETGLENGLWRRCFGAATESDGRLRCNPIQYETAHGNQQPETRQRGTDFPMTMKSTAGKIQCSKRH